MKKYKLAFILTIGLFVIFAFKSLTLAQVGSDICDTGCKPLMDMQSGQTYYGETGGLYGNYQNTPPLAHINKLNEAKSAITPRNTLGNPDPNGKIVLLTNGMSNTNMKSNAFINQANLDSDVSSKVVIVNGARGSITAERWATNYNTQWDTYVMNQLGKENVTAAQVQVIWMLHANFAEPGSCVNCMAANKEYVNSLHSDLKAIIGQIKSRFPNIKIIYLSNRSYGGYATVDLNDEPYAFENGIAVRKTILDQINGTDPSLNYSTTPVLVWGPQLWADDNHPNSQGLSWTASDFTTTDGTHPVQGVAGKGAEKAGAFILNFFKTSTYSASWFTRSSDPNPTTANPTNTPITSPIPTTPQGNYIPGDLNKDGVVNVLDFNLLSAAFGTNNASADIDGNGIVNIQDFTILSNNFGKTSLPVTPTKPINTATPTPFSITQSPTGSVTLGRNLLINPGFGKSSTECYNPTVINTQITGWFNEHFGFGEHRQGEGFPQNMSFKSCAARTKGEAYGTGDGGKIPLGQSARLSQVVAVPNYSKIIFRSAREEHESGTVTHRIYGCPNSTGTNCTLMGQTNSTIPQVTDKNICDFYIQSLTLAQNSGISSVTYGEPQSCGNNVVSSTPFSVLAFNIYPYIKVEAQITPLNGEGQSGYKAGWMSLEVL